MASESSGASPKRNQLMRILRWLCYAVLLTLLISFTGVWVAYTYRVSIANHLLTYVGPYEVTVRTLEIDRLGMLEAKDLKVRHREQESAWLSVPELTVKPGWKELTSGRIGELKIRRPTLQLNDALLNEWIELSRKSSDQNEPLQPSSPMPFYLSEILLDDATLRWKSDSTPEVELTLNYHGERITRDAQGLLNSGLQTLEVRGAKVISEKDNDAPPLQLEQFLVKGSVEDGWLHLSDVELAGLSVFLKLSMLKWLNKDSQTSTATLADEVPKSSPMLLGIKIDHLQARDLTLKVEGSKDDEPVLAGILLPDFSNEMEISIANVKLDFASKESWEIGEWSWLNQNLLLSAPGNEGHVKIDHLEAQGKTLSWPGEVHLTKLQITAPNILWTDHLSQRLFLSESTESTEPSEDKKSAPWQINIDEGAMTQGKLKLKSPSLMEFEISADLSLHLAAISFGSNGWSSTKPQTLKVTGGSLKFPDESDEKTKLPFFELPNAELVMVPDQWQASREVEKLVLNQPHLRIRDGNTPWADADGERPKPQNQTSQATQPTEQTDSTPWWQALHFNQLTLTNGVSDLLVPAPKPIEAKGDINIHTTFKDGVAQHHVKLENVEARLPTLSRLPFPVAKFSLFEGTVRLPQLWQERRIDSLKLEGANLEASEAMMGLMEGDKQADTNPDTAPTTTQPTTTNNSAPAWSVGRLDVQQSSVTIVNLVPGLPAVKFNLQFHAEDSPLWSEDLAKNFAPQKVELANLTIPSPYEPLRPVAELDNIFVHFTLQGLMNKKIDKVEIISPTLYVGEDLFWYVDYYRQYVNSDPKAKPREALLVSTEEAMALKAANVLMDAEPDAKEAAWSIGRLQIHSGKLILAPKGKPMKGFGKPLPFDINTEVVQGTLEAELEIPPDVYTLEQYKLQFEGMHGKVHFNLPLKQKDNNLVETFEVDRIRWKELQTGKAYLTITYDKAGIYAKFGAEAYEGYVNGELNIYNDDSYSWDGWIGGKNVQTTELTTKLFPTYFFMQGQVEATVVAQGNMHELFQADGSFKNHSPGKFSITALNDAVKNLPGDWSQLEKQLTQIGLETLRDFEYDDANAEFRLYGREGQGKVQFRGPHGSRNFDINVYDHRWTTSEPPMSARQSTSNE